MSGKFWDIDAVLEQSRKAQLEAAQKAFEEAKQVAADEISETISDDLANIYESSVAAWYRAYIPSMYNRTHQLYGLLDIDDHSKEGNIDIRWKISGDGLRYKSWGRGTFNPWVQIFLVGFHGGWIKTRTQGSGSVEVSDGLRWPVQSTPIPEMFELSKSELEKSYSNRLLAILSRETMDRYNKYYN